MPRPKSIPDRVPLVAVLHLLQSGGPGAVTFASTSQRCGLSPATLVQRFGSKHGMLARALRLAWDDLDALTARVLDTHGRTPADAIAILTALSQDAHDATAHAAGLRVLAEDIADPAARERGHAWGQVLLAALEECLGSRPKARVLLEQWQGIWVWWSFDPRGNLRDHIEERLTEALNPPSPRDSPGR